MSRFDSYIDKHINEAFSSANLGKAIKNIKIVIQRTLGTELLPFGNEKSEKFKRSNGVSGFGVYYLVDKFDMVIRFNWEQKKKSNTITSVDAWKDINNIFVNPDATLDIPSDYNIIQSIGIICNFIKKPRVGVINEAKGDKKRALADKWNLDPEMSYAEIQKAVTKKKRLMAVKGVSEDNTIIQDAAKAQKELDKQQYADPDIVFDDLDDLVRMVAGNIQPSLLITGMAGIGKCVYSNTDVPVVFG